MSSTMFSEFDDLKISALRKSKSINKYVQNVTIGPNCSPPSTNNTNNVWLHDKKINLDSTNKPPAARDLNNSHNSVGKALIDIESQMKEEVQSSVRLRVERMQFASNEINTHYKTEWAKTQQRLFDEVQMLEESMMKDLDEQDRKACDDFQQRQLHYQKQAEERSKRNLELQMKERQRHQLLRLIESIQEKQHAFRLLYQEIAVIFKECSNTIVQNNSEKFACMSTVSLRLKSLLDVMEKIKEKCKAGSCTNNDLETANLLIVEANKLKATLQTILATKLQEQQQQQQQKEEKSKQEIATSVKTATELQENKPPADATDSVSLSENPQVKPSKPVTVTAASTSVISTEKSNTGNNEGTSQKAEKQQVSSALSVIETFVSKNSLKMYSNLQQYLETYKNGFAQLASDPRLKQFRFLCQKAVNIPLNAISAVSFQHMQDKYQRLSNLLRGKSVEAGGTIVVSSQHPQGVAFCTDLLARKFVLQGDLLISSNPESAHCYAAMMAALWHDFPDFGKLVLAYFYKTVPCLVPFYPPKVSGQSDQDYYTSLGYNYVDGVVEKQDKFLKRMSGITRLYAAVTISRLKRGQQGPHPHGLACAWRWIANVLNIEPRSDITATLLFDFLEVTGSSLQAAYGIQFQKLLTFINNIYLQKMQKIDSGGPVTRIEVFLQKVKRTGLIESPKGRLPEGFW